jgi:hypothetical protein
MSFTGRVLREEPDRLVFGMRLVIFAYLFDCLPIPTLW